LNLPEDKTTSDFFLNLGFLGKNGDFGCFSGVILVFGVKTGAGGLGLYLVSRIAYCVSCWGIGFDGVRIGFVFPEPEGVVYFHNPLLKQQLRSFEHPANWLCFGFVFLDCESVVFSVILCYK